MEKYDTNFLDKEKENPLHEIQKYKDEDPGPPLGDLSAAPQNPLQEQVFSMQVTGTRKEWQPKPIPELES